MNTKLNPSMRAKRRYLLLQNATKEEAERVILDYIGILGWAKAQPLFVSSKNGNIILSIDRKEIDNIRGAFELGDKKIKVLRVSGSLKGLK